jgi:hypothetical protein
MAAFPSWSVLDMALGGDHNLFPIEWFIYGAFSLCSLAGAVVGVGWSVHFDGRRTGVMTRRALGVLFCLWMVGCATTWYARRPQAERSSYMAAGALKQGMTFYDVVFVMLNVRRPNQYASLDSGRECTAASVDVIVHAGELLAKVSRTSVYAGGFASIRSIREQALAYEGFERQATLLDAVRARESELLVCRDAVLSFDAVTEGGCGRDTIPLKFGEDGRLTTIGSVASTQCGH